MTTRRMTVSQALVEFLAHQWTVDGDHRERTIAGIVRHLRPRQRRRHRPGAQAAQRRSEPDLMPYHQARNEQAMVHQSVGYARMHRAARTFACAASVGPGRDQHAHRRRARHRPTGCRRCCCRATPSRPGSPTRCCSSSSCPHDTGISVNDAFRPLSRFFDRVQRPEQLFSIALAAMRVLTDPAETGAVTIALPEDVQAEALDVPVEFLRRPRVAPAPAAARARARSRAAVRAIRGCARPLIVAGGGVHLLGCRGRAPRARRSDRHPGRHDAGRRRLAAVGPPAVPRRRRRDRHHGGEPARRRGRS